MGQALLFVHDTMPVAALAFPLEAAQDDATVFIKEPTLRADGWALGPEVFLAVNRESLALG